jgi:hypothetical protein
MLDFSAHPLFEILIIEFSIIRILVIIILVIIIGTLFNIILGYLLLYEDFKRIYSYNSIVNYLFFILYFHPSYLSIYFINH